MVCAAMSAMVDAVGGVRSRGCRSGAESGDGESGDEVGA
jgi:hypothetical protein